MEEKIVQRQEFLNRLIKLREKQPIKVVTGVRRCGKSTLLSLYIDYLKASGVRDEQIVSLNLENPKYEHLLHHKALYTYLQKRLCKNGFTYIFIDEVQQCEKFEKAIDGLFIQKNVDLYITGSNAYMLSGELATLLSGRYVTIDMLPLSFAEYVEFTATVQENIKSVFNDYLKNGAFPYVASLKNDEIVIKDYLDGIYNSILIKDVVKREHINDISVLESIVKFLAGNVGSPVSAKKIRDTINSAGRKISVNTV